MQESQVHLIDEVFERAAPKTGAWPDAPSFVVYGAGGCGRGVAALLRSRGKRVRAFIDQKAQPGDRIDNIPVFSPASITPETGEAAIIGIFNPESDVRPVVAWLEGMGFASVVPFTVFHRTVGDAADNRYWLSAGFDYGTHREDVRELWALLGDDKSRATLLNLLKLRLHHDLHAQAEPDVAQYLPPDVPGWRAPRRFLDGGAFDGDTLRQFTSSGRTLEAYAGFEPDPENFALLNAHARSLSEATECALWPCALWERTETLHFAAQGKASSHLVAEGERPVQAVAIDDILVGWHPDTIKLDIESAEPAALRGAAGVIGQSRPQLAVCAYHQPGHLWELPFQVRDMDLNYALYLRQHGQTGFETVLYAVPR